MSIHPGRQLARRMQLDRDPTLGYVDMPMDEELTQQQKYDMTIAKARRRSELFRLRMQMRHKS